MGPHCLLSLSKLTKEALGYIAIFEPSSLFSLEIIVLRTKQNPNTMRLSCQSSARTGMPVDLLIPKNVETHFQLIRFWFSRGFVMVYLVSFWQKDYWPCQTWRATESSPLAIITLQKWKISPYKWRTNHFKIDHVVLLFVHLFPCKSASSWSSKRQKQATVFLTLCFVLQSKGWAEWVLRTAPP